MKIFALVPLFLAFSFLAFAQNTITVSGDADYSYPVTRAKITFSVRGEGPSLTEAQADWQKKSTKVLADLKTVFGATPQSVSQTRYSSQPDYEYQGEKGRVLRAYVSESDYEYTHDLLAKQSAILEQLVKNQVSAISQVELLHDANDDILKDAYAKAYQDAFFRARAILAGSGGRVGRVQRVVDGGAREAPVVAQGPAVASFREASNLVGSVTKNHISLTITFEIKYE